MKFNGPKEPKRVRICWSSLCLLLLVNSGKGSILFEKMIQIAFHFFLDYGLCIICITNIYGILEVYLSEMFGKITF